MPVEDQRKTGFGNPASRIDGQSLPWGRCFTSAFEGQESHLREAQVIKDFSVFVLHP
jgi:hypothetical protein